MCMAANTYYFDDVLSSTFVFFSVSFVCLSTYYYINGTAQLVR